MTGNDGFKPLGVQALTCLLEFGNRRLGNATDPLGRAATAINAPPNVTDAILEKLNDDARPSDFTPSEARFLAAVRLYGDTKSEITRARSAFEWRTREWGNDNIELIEGAVTRAVDDHLSGQARAVAGLTDAEIRSIRRGVTQHARLLAQDLIAQIVQIAETDEVDVKDSVDAAVAALLARAASVNPPDTLRLIISAHSRGQLELSTVRVTREVLPDKLTLRPLAKQLLELESLKAQIPGMKQETEAAFEALESTAAKARWDAAAPSP